MKVMEGAWNLSICPNLPVLFVINEPMALFKKEKTWNKTNNKNKNFLAF